METPSPKYRLRFRHLLQIAMFLIVLAIGLQFIIFVHQATSSAFVTVQRPPGVEAFLPIGALMGWKLFLKTGMWDPIHPAAMVILGFSAGVCFMLRKSFCAWICPVGTLSEWLWKLGRRWVGRNYRLPTYIDYLLRGIKYALLGFFLWVIIQMDTRSIIQFLQSPYYKMSDVKMLHFFTRMSALTAWVLLFLTIGSLFVRNFWCRYLCPYGALMGLLALFGPTRIIRDTKRCIDCSRCTKACPYHLPVDKKSKIVSPECNGCLDCIHVCPEKGALSLNTIGRPQKSWTATGIGLTILLTFAVSIYTARITGKWQSVVQTVEFQRLLKRIDAPQMAHPTTNTFEHQRKPH